MWTSCSSPSLVVGDPAQKRQEILDVYVSQWELYEDLFARLTDAGLTQRADPLRHPLIFYFGHTAVFYVNKLVVGGILSPNARVNKVYESLFAIGVDEMSWDDLLPDNHAWPSRADIKAYRDTVRNLVVRVIKETPLEKDSLITWSHPLWIILMGIEHELIHLETSSVLIRQLPLDCIVADRPCRLPAECADRGAQSVAQGLSLQFVELAGGEVRLGRCLPSLGVKRGPGDVYGWDNEYGAHQARVDRLCLAERLVTNWDYFKFVAAKGYEQQAYWTAEGWKWVQFAKAQFPRFWVYNGETGTPFDANKFVQRNVYSESTTMPWDWPVEVNCLEASAYCRWLGESLSIPNIRLPTEDEYALAINSFLAGSKAGDKFDANNHLSRYASSCPVDKFKHGKFFDLVGNVWQWTRTPFYPFNNFKEHGIYDDFSMPTFDDNHNIIKGGSWISLGNESSKYSRYAFRRHFYQHAGFRVAYSPDNQTKPVLTDYDPMNKLELVDGQSQEGNIYETDALVAMYNEFHFGPQAMIPVEKFPVVCARIVELVLKTSPFWEARGVKNIRVMDLGCATGRTSFEISRFANYTLGIDFSTKFIQVAYSLLKQGRLNWKVLTEGELTQYREARLLQEPAEVLCDTEIENPIKLFGKEDDGWWLLSKLFGSDVTDLLINADAYQNREHVPLDSLRFLQGDACNLKSIDGSNQFEAIIAANLIDRLYSPNQFLESVGSRIVTGGFLVLLSPFTWLKEYTEIDNWVGGKKVDGENRTTMEGLKLILAKDFDFIPTHELKRNIRRSMNLPEKVPQSASNGFFMHTDDLKEGIETFRVPMVIRETVNKHQCTFSVVSIWRKR